MIFCNRIHWDWLHVPDSSSKCLHIEPNKNPFTAFETVSKWYSLVAVVNIKRNVFYKIRKYSKRNAFAVFSCQDVSAKYADEYKKQQLIESIFKYFIFIWERKKSLQCSVLGIFCIVKCYCHDNTACVHYIYVL